jgi:protein-S-isoprenylcysteine O-methyltransferase Ste14
MTKARLWALDAFERIAILLLYGALVFRMVDGVRTGAAGFGSLLVLVSEGMVLAFVLFRRRASDVSSRPLDWLLALAATCLPMLVTTSSGRPLAPPVVGALIIVMGTLIQVHGKLVLGRSFGCVPAHRGLKTAGPYRFVRHPIYAGYMLNHLGFLLMQPSLWNLSLYLVCNLVQIPRLLAEERLLIRDESYQKYAALVRHRLVPGVY